MGAAKYMQGIAWLWSKPDCNNVIATEPIQKVSLIMCYSLDLSCQAVFSTVVTVCVYGPTFLHYLLAVFHGVALDAVFFCPYHE